jgi:hypothetical protein
MHAAWICPDKPAAALWDVVDQARELWNVVDQRAWAGGAVVRLAALQHSTAQHDADGPVLLSLAALHVLQRCLVLLPNSHDR